MYNLIEELILPSILSVEDLAYVEEASGTLEMLKYIETVIRYSQHHRSKELFESEMIVVEAVLELYRYRFGSFQYKLEWDESNKYIELEKYSVINEVLKIVQEKLKEVGSYNQLNIGVEVINDEAISVFLRRT